MTDWQPISTAPKDGTRFLAWHSSGEVTPLEVTGTSFEHTEAHPAYDVRAVALNMASHRGLGEFTHWMPLPEPPKPEAS